MRYIYLFLFLFTLSFSVNAQQGTLSTEAEISVMTIGPGAYLYDKFGHSAIRVKDPINGIDKVYNYGSYDFDTPNFYTKFARGKLLYSLSTRPFDPFLNFYKGQNRWIKEQVLNLTSEEESELFAYLENNAKTENKDYLYDFLQDNCATRIRDVLKASLGKKLQYNDEFVDEEYTYRQLIQKNVKANSWGSLGMDVAIGAVTDRTATAWDYQFLPDYVYKATETATIERGGTKIPLVRENRVLFQNNPVDDSGNFFLSPLFIFGIIGLLIIWVTFRDYKKQTRSRYLDFTILFVTGIIGILLSLLWWGTDHSTTVGNYNLLWALPFSILVAFLIVKSTPKKWVRRYVIFLILLLLLIAIHWLTGVQEFAIGFIPLFMALAIRYFYVQWFLKQSN